MRLVFLILLILCATVLTACSYLTDFVVINESAQPIVIRYKIKIGSYDPLSLTGDPARIATSRLHDRNKEWEKLTIEQYQLDRESRTVEARVMSGEALRIAIVYRYGGHEDPYEVEHYPVEEITVVGADGELKLVGELARKSFVKESISLYTLTYK